MQSTFSASSCARSVVLKLQVVLAATNLIFLGDSIGGKGAKRSAPPRHLVGAHIR